MSKARVKPPVHTIVALRPNGVEYSREDQGDTSPYAIDQRAGAIIGEIRSDRGWTPTIRVLVTEKGETHDRTHLYRVGA